MMELIHQLIDLGVKAEDQRFYSQLGDRLETYEFFQLLWIEKSVQSVLMDTPYGTLQDMVDYALAHEDQELTLSYYGYVDKDGSIRG